VNYVRIDGEPKAEQVEDELLEECHEQLKGGGGEIDANISLRSPEKPSVVELRPGRKIPICESTPFLDILL
jgi:hypothetical protein